MNKKEENKSYPKCPYCGREIRYATSYFPHCNWECEEKSIAFDREYNDMKDGFTTG